MGVTDLVVKNFAGLNLRDAADKVQDNEFTQLQNVWQPSKGVFSPRFGSLIDHFTNNTISLAQRVSGLWRHYSANGERFTLYHCIPDSNLLPDNTVDLGLLEILDGNGNIFGFGGIETLRICYSWIGCGLEQTYNSKNRVGYPAVPATFGAAANPGHQTITPTVLDSTIQVTVPSFPPGVSGANIFVARGSSTQMTLMGTCTVSGGTFLVREFIGPTSANVDSFYDLLATQTVTSFGKTATDVANLYQAYLAALSKVTVENGQVLANNAFDFAAGTQDIATYFAARDAWQNAAKSAAGQLTPSTTYDFVLAVVRKDTRQILSVSPVFSGTTAAGATALSVAIVPLNTLDGTVYTVYAGPHSGALHAQADITSGPFILHNLITNGDTAPSVSSSGVPVIYGGNTNDGTLIPGEYWVAFAWVTDPGFVEGTAKTPSVRVQAAQRITLSKENNVIGVHFFPDNPSTNGAQSIYVFVGTQDPSKHPMTLAGIARYGINQFFDIKSIPATNAQTCPQLLGPDKNQPLFCHYVNDGFIGGVKYLQGSRVQSRFGFLISFRESSQTLQEVFPSRSLMSIVFSNLDRVVYAGDYFQQVSQQAPIQLHNWAPQPKTQNDIYALADDGEPFVQPYAWTNTPIDPVFCYMLGISYFVNGADIPWQTDGYTLAQIGAIGAINQTLLPPIPKYIFAYQSCLVVSGSQAGNQIYASNANSPMNWATGGDGTLLRFVTIGDAVGSGVSAQGIFTPQTEATGNPGSYIIAFKKVGAWMISNIPDPSISSIIGNIGGQTSAHMIQISGRTGCTAYRSIVNTPMGTIFMGQDADIHLISRVAEPRRIGTKIQNLLIHLVGLDEQMKKITAVYHDNHYKLAYPSTVNGPCDRELWADLRTGDGDKITWMGPHLGRNMGAQLVLAGDRDNLSRLFAVATHPQTQIADDPSSRNDINEAVTYVQIIQQIKSKIYRLGAEGHAKRTLGATLDIYLDLSYNNTILFEAFADSQYQSVNRLLSSGGGSWDIGQWDQSNYADAEYLPYSFLFGQSNLIGNTLQFRITKSDSAPFVLASVLGLVKIEKRRVVN